MTFGLATVSVGQGADWDTLVADSTRADRSRSYPLRVSRVEPMGVFGDTLGTLEAHEGRIRLKADAAALFAQQFEAFDQYLEERLARADRREVLVFVHGFNNRLEDAAIRMAQAWHLGGRSGVPIVYTWPAGSGGLKGYAYDRESGEFTIVHLKLLLWALARHPGVEKVHLLSHSRGTDVATTALRELHNEIRGAQHTSLVGAALGAPQAEPRETYEILKLETLVLAAPDMDIDVFVQRFFAENLLRGARRVVVYASEKDQALGLADWLFRSRRRLGALRLTDLRPEGRALLAHTSALELIDCSVTGGSSHAYMAEHPAALSDLLVLLREGAPAGDPRRPLRRAEEAVWLLDNSYLRPMPAATYTGWPD
jgi:esterase/lipase superfamily enzyme